MTTETLSTKQAEALALIDKHGSSFVSNRTMVSANMVSVLTARSLVQRGLCEIDLAGDGQWIRRTK